MKVEKAISSCTTHTEKLKSEKHSTWTGTAMIKTLFIGVWCMLHLLWAMSARKKVNIGR